MKPRQNFSLGFFYQKEEYDGVILPFLIRFKNKPPKGNPIAESPRVLWRGIY